MVDLTSEEIVTLREVVRILPRQPNGKALHISTLYRWCSRGLRGVQLESLRLGGRVVTSIEALQRFAERCSTAESTAGSSTTQRRKREIERAEAALNKAGI